jgi:hypothetical protein
MARISQLHEGIDHSISLKTSFQRNFSLYESKQGVYAWVLLVSHFENLNVHFAILLAKSSEFCVVNLVLHTQLSDLGVLGGGVVHVHSSYESLIIFIQNRVFCVYYGYEWHLSTNNLHSRYRVADCNKIVSPKRKRELIICCNVLNHAFLEIERGGGSQTLQ